MNAYYQENIEKYTELKQDFLNSARELKTELKSLGLNSEEQILTQVCQSYMCYFQNSIEVNQEKLTETSLKQHFKTIETLTNEIQKQADYCSSTKQNRNDGVTSLHVKGSEKDPAFLFRQVKREISTLCNDIRNETKNQKQVIAR